MTALETLLVRTPTEKVEALARIATDHFQKGERILILVDNEAAAQFVDELLWRLPPDSFLPHAIGSDEPISISVREENPNSATILLSLRENAPSIATTFDLVYDLDDQTSPQRHAAAQERQRAYGAMGLFSLSASSTKEARV